MKTPTLFRSIAVLIIIFFGYKVLAVVIELNIPNTFSSSNPITEKALNENFKNIKLAVDEIFVAVRRKVSTNAIEDKAITREKIAKAAISSVHLTSDVQTSIGYINFKTEVAASGQKSKMLKKFQVIFPGAGNLFFYVNASGNIRVPKGSMQIPFARAGKISLCQGEDMSVSCTSGVIRQLYVENVEGSFWLADGSDANFQRIEAVEEAGRKTYSIFLNASGISAGKPTEAFADGVVTVMFIPKTLYVGDPISKPILRVPK
jgi:hypothetical protein